MSSQSKGGLLNSVITFLSFVDTNMLIPVIALYASSLGAKVGMIGILVGIYSVTNFIVNIFAGRWIDRLGFKKPLIIGLFGDALAMFFYSLCKAPWHLALTRAFHGSSGGLTGPATMSATGTYAQASGKAKAMSYYGIAIAAATLAGHGAGGALATRMGYNFLFYTGIALLCAGTVLAFFLPSYSSNAGTGPDKSVSVHLSELFSLFKRGDLSVSYCAIFAQYFSFGGVVALLPLHVASLHMEAVHVGILLIIFSTMFIFVQFFAGGMSDRTGRLKPTAVALSLICVALIFMPFTISFTTLAITLALYGTGYGILFPAISALLIDRAAEDEYGKVTGLFHALITAGVAVGAPIAGWIAAASNLRTGLMMTPIAIVFALIITIVKLSRNRTDYNGQ
jgi:DHA1 family multidrug resistance protein-like MFS transporter